MELVACFGCFQLRRNKLVRPSNLVISASYTSNHIFWATFETNSMFWSNYITLVYVVCFLYFPVILLCMSVYILHTLLLRGYQLVAFFDYKKINKFIYTSLQRKKAWGWVRYILMTSNQPTPWANKAENGRVIRRT